MVNSLLKLSNACVTWQKLVDSPMTISEWYVLGLVAERDLEFVNARIIIIVEMGAY